MDVMFTTHPNDGPGKYYMVVASQGDWTELLRNLDGIGHSPAALNLIAAFKSWGITK